MGSPGATVLLMMFWLAVFLILHNGPLLIFCGCLMLVQVAVGVLGSYYELRGNLEQPGGTMWEKFLYGAPIFAPLLFADLSLLALLALWALAMQPAPQRNS
jgi:hypothetical protein